MNGLMWLIIAVLFCPPCSLARLSVVVLLDDAVPSIRGISFPMHWNSIVPLLDTVYQSVRVRGNSSQGGRLYVRPWTESLELFSVFPQHQDVPMQLVEYVALEQCEKDFEDGVILVVLASSVPCCGWLDVARALTSSASKKNVAWTLGQSSVVVSCRSLSRTTRKPVLDDHLYRFSREMFVSPSQAAPCHQLVDGGEKVVHAPIDLDRICGTPLLGGLVGGSDVLFGTEQLGAPVVRWAQSSLPLSCDAVCSMWNEQCTEPPSPDFADSFLATLVRRLVEPDITLITAADARRMLVDSGPRLLTQHNQGAVHHAQSPNSAEGLMASDLFINGSVVQSKWLMIGRRFARSSRFSCSFVGPQRMCWCRARRAAAGKSSNDERTSDNGACANVGVERKCLWPGLLLLGNQRCEPVVAGPLRFRHQDRFEIDKQLRLAASEAKVAAQWSDCIYNLHCMPGSEPQGDKMVVVRGGTKAPICRLCLPGQSAAAWSKCMPCSTASKFNQTTGLPFGQPRCN